MSDASCEFDFTWSAIQGRSVICRHFNLVTSTKPRAAFQLLPRTSLPGGRYGTERRFEIEIRPEVAVAFVVAKKVSVFRVCVKVARKRSYRTNATASMPVISHQASPKNRNVLLQRRLYIITRT